MSLVSELKTIADYNPTAYVNNSEPDLDAEHLNKTGFKAGDGCGK